MEPTQNEFLEAVVCAITSIGPDVAFILGYIMMLLLTLKGMFPIDRYGTVNRYDGGRPELETYFFRFYDDIILIFIFTKDNNFILFCYF